MPSENPSEEQRKPRPPWPDPDDALQAWHDQEKYFWSNHEQVLAIQHVLGLRACYTRKKLIIVLVDATADIDAVEDAVIECMAKLGLPDNHYTVEACEKPAGITYHRPYVPHKYPEKAPPDAT